MKEINYERGIHLFLSIFRFFSFLIAVFLAQGVPLIQDKAPPFQTYLIIGVLGIYTLLKVFPPKPLGLTGKIGLVMVSGDLAVCISLVLFTGGLNSPYLLYSFIPVITAALLFEQEVALVSALFSSLSLTVAHTAFNELSTQYTFIMEGNNLQLLIVYIISSFLIATLAFRANLNIRQRIHEKAIVEERRRIRRELHDGVAQAIGYVNMRTRLARDHVSSSRNAEALAELQQITDALGDTYDDIRETIDQLNIDVADFALVRSLSSYVREFTKKFSIPVQFDAPRSFRPISPYAELQLLRIAQEALANVRKHSQARQVWVTLEEKKSDINLTIKDNGKGLVPGPGTKHQNSNSTHGMTIMKERAELLGGQLTVSSQPGAGTEIAIVIPKAKARS
ncbi:MAG: sensor histidine kinase [Chloroflexi bacterium]|nr:sensor histidine kinase [Chloroflexota bacterium]